MDRGREEKREREKEKSTDISSEIVTIVKLRDIASHNETVNCIRDIVMLRMECIANIGLAGFVAHNSMRHQNTFVPDAPL